MFNLEKQLESWKTQFAGSDSVTAEGLEELELHLRETTASLQQNELSEEEAFLIASKRLGQPFDLDEEYGKANPALVWKKRIFWAIIGYSASISFAHFISGLAAIASGVAAYAGWGSTITGIIWIAVVSIGWGAFLAMVYRCTKKQSSRQFNSRHSILWGLALAATMLVGYGISFQINSAGHFFHTNSVGSNEFSISSVITAYGSAIIHLLVVLACITMLAVLGRQEKSREKTVVS